MREHDIYEIEAGEMAENWLEVRPGKTVKRGKACEYEFAEEVIGLLEFTDSTFLVGVGESARPFQLLYEGTSREAAEQAFDRAVQHHDSL